MDVQATRAQRMQAAADHAQTAHDMAGDLASSADDHAERQRLLEARQQLALALQSLDAAMLIEAGQQGLGL